MGLNPDICTEHCDYHSPRTMELPERMRRHRHRDPWCTVGNKPMAVGDQPPESCPYITEHVVSGDHDD